MFTLSPLRHYDEHQPISYAKNSVQPIIKVVKFTAHAQ